MHWIIVLWAVFAPGQAPEYVGTVKGASFDIQLKCEAKADEIRRGLVKAFPDVPVVVACVQGGET